LLISKLKITLAILCPYPLSSILSQRERRIYCITPSLLGEGWGEVDVSLTPSPLSSPGGRGRFFIRRTVLC